MKRRLLIVMLILFVTVATLAGQAWHVRRALPDSFEATSVSYSYSHGTGFGPGANEVGFSVIHLSEAGALRIAEGGIAWLNAQPGGRLQPDWSATPVPRDEFWMGHPDSAMGAWPNPTVNAVLSRYGLDFDPPLEHQTALDAALNAPGSFYAFGPGGLVAVIVPGTQRAYVFYAG
ncbi:MAG: hypothetical protein MUE83_08090 [Tabrizicola sp.]|nr:hypothetical protein [Tabrizicola sp.]